MKLPASLSKLKSLFPVFVVGASVAITIKLLTESTPLTSEILQVKAEEDIFESKYEDVLEPPEPEQEPPKEEDPPQQDDSITPEQQEENKPSEEDKKDTENQDPSEDQQKQQDNQQEKPPSSGRKFNTTGVGKILSELFKSKRKG